MWTLSIRVHWKWSSVCWWVLSIFPRMKFNSEQRWIQWLARASTRENILPPRGKFELFANSERKKLCILSLMISNNLTSIAIFVWKFKRTLWSIKKLSFLTPVDSKNWKIVKYLNADNQVENTLWSYTQGTLKERLMITYVNVQTVFTQWCTLLINWRYAFFFRHRRMPK